MLRISKQFILFLMFVIKLFKQLIAGLSVFVYKRVSASRWGMFACFAVIAIVICASVIILNAMPQGIAAGSKTTQKGFSQEVPGFNIDRELSEIEQTRNLLAQASADAGQDIEDPGAISFQAMAESTSIGRSEPFAPSFGYGSSFGGSNTSSVGPIEFGGEASALSPEELAKQEAERRRQEITDALSNDFSVKGIVMDMGANENPMVIAEVMDSSGMPVVKTLALGETVRLSVCEAKVKQIYSNRVLLVSEDVSVERHLPGYDDESLDSTGSTSSASSIPTDFGGGMNTMSPPPTPGGGSKGGSSMSDAKQKIEEIDKLLDSF